MRGKDVSKKNKEVPFCDECPNAVDFGPWVTTSAGPLPVKVKHIDGKVACVSCPHQHMRAQVLGQVSHQPAA